MAAFDYGRPKATADRLLARFGRSATLRRPTRSGTSYNPTEGTPVDTTVTVAVFDYNERQVDGTRILATDKRVLMAKEAVSETPTPSHLLLIGAVTHKIVAVKTLSPAGTVVLWELQARI